MAKPFTPRQGQYLAYIETYTRTRGYPPSETDIAGYFGVSPPSAHQMLVALERLGLVERFPWIPRSVRVLAPPQDLPVLEGLAKLAKPPPPFDTVYPNIAHWLSHGGEIRIGGSGHAGPAACTLQDGRMVWQGSREYESTDHLLRDMDAALGREMSARR